MTLEKKYIASKSQKCSLYYALPLHFKQVGALEPSGNQQCSFKNSSKLLILLYKIR